MIKKVFKPLWSVNVQKTEKWLSNMSAKGYHLEEINLLTRKFTFKSGAPKKLTYRIGYQRGGHIMPTALKQDGWVEVISQKSWYIIANEKEDSKIKRSPVRFGLYKRNSLMLTICAAFLIYGTLNLVFQLSLFGLVYFAEVPVTIVKSPLWILTFIFWSAAIVFWCSIIYSTFALIKSNKNLQLNNVEQTYFEEPKDSKNPVIKKRFILWWIYPDKLEKWLENMERQGYNLHRIGKKGITYWFEKGSPRKIKYCIDFQRRLDLGYYDIHKENGWNLVFTRKNYPGTWSLWAQQYKETLPQFYSEKSDAIKHAKNVLKVNFQWPLLLPLAVLIPSTFNQIQQGITTIDIISTIIIAIIIIQLTLLTTLSLCYYRRVKKSISQ
ncbi:DUF2812 domain-containing protein [Proteinivorax hydrogeniformans]|uniref:DUF2812 domain-containing protein n=1 Tax=Proteinivorax hydrogeniformans TaxID=1826727 RepID=A0AAU8HUB9_9FIRM